jgi:hypothetical protein
MNLDYSFELDWPRAEREGQVRYDKYANHGTNPTIGVRGQVAGVAGEMAFSRDFLLEREAEIEEGSRGDKGIDFTIATGETVDIKARELPSVASNGRLIIASRQSYGVFEKHCKADIIAFAWRPKDTDRIRLDGWLTQEEVKRFPLKTWIDGGKPSFTIPTESIHPIETLLKRHLEAPERFDFLHLEMASRVFEGAIMDFATVTRVNKSWSCVDGVILSDEHTKHIKAMEYEDRKPYFLALQQRALEQGCLFIPSIKMGDVLETFEGELVPSGEHGEEVEAANDTAG